MESKVQVTSVKVQIHGFLGNLSGAEPLLMVLATPALTVNMSAVTVESAEQYNRWLTGWTLKTEQSSRWSINFSKCKKLWMFSKCGEIFPSISINPSLFITFLTANYVSVFLCQLSGPISGTEATMGTYCGCTMAAGRYQRAVQQFIGALQGAGLGTWVRKPPELSHFNISVWKSVLKAEYRGFGVFFECEWRAEIELKSLLCKRAQSIHKT